MFYLKKKHIKHLDRMMTGKIKKNFKRNCSVIVADSLENQDL